MSAVHETPVVAPEATTTFGVDATAPTTTDVETVEPSTTEPHGLTEPVDAPAAAAAASDPPAAVAEPGKEDAVKIEAVPITSGNLGFKTGPLKLFKFSQRYFWLGDEAPLEESTIAHFHKGNHENKHHTAAHASQTGKGLLLYAKRAEDTTQPEGIFNLAEVSDVAKDGALEFFFKIHDKKQSFQATKTTERDGWLVAINNAVTEAISSKETLRETDGYKDSYKKYFGAGTALAAGSTVGAASAAAKENKAETKAEDGAAVPATETATTKKDGSRSRSRGPLGLFKQTKEKTVANIETAKEKAEIKKEEKKEEKAEAKKEEEVAAVGTGAATGAAVAATESEAKTPTQKKRQSSIFGLFKKNEDKTATPVKDTEPVAAEAPKIDTVADTGAPLTEPTPAETVTETPAATTEATPAVIDTTSAAPAAVAGKTQRSPSPKGKGFGGLFSRSDKKATKTEETLPAATTTTESTTPAINTEPTPVTDSITPAVETTATETTPLETAAPVTETKPTGTTKTQDKRRSSLQAFLGFGKNKDVTAATTKEPEVAADGKETFADLPKKDKLSGMFRSSSKKVKETPATTADAPPVPAKDTEPIAESTTEPTADPIAESYAAGEITSGEATLVERPGGTAVPGFGAPVAT